MKTNKNSILHYSLFAVLIGMVPMAAFSAIRVGNHSRSYADAYNQVNAAVSAARAPGATTQMGSVPANTAGSGVASGTVPGATATNAGDAASSVSLEMQRCSMIYPNGEFELTRPTLGRGAGGASTCTAVVELRAIQAGQNGEDLILARANLAAGDSIRCNISDFPAATHNNSISGTVVVPADNPPTMDDVIRVMNEEQKKNAGIRIATGAIMGALVGNMSGENDVGNDSLMGTDRGKLRNSAIGGLAGAALMAGNAYAGKMGGDIILSTGVNAAAGGMIGNIIATGDSVLRIEDCEIDGRDTSCLWGMLVTGKDLNLASGNETAFYNLATQETYVCDANMENCKPEELISIVLTAQPDKYIDEIDQNELNETIFADPSKHFHLEKSTTPDGAQSTGVSIKAGSGGTDGDFVQIASAARIDRQIAAMIPDVRDKAFGMKQSDWRDWKRSHQSGVTIYGRGANGVAYDLSVENTEYTLNDFKPMMVDAADGGIIDLGNKARLKSTLIGAGAGGAMGAFVGYQGAQTDIENRWVTATREYKDSLQKVYCATGNRFLGFYNDTIFIPSLSESE